MTSDAGLLLPRQFAKRLGLGNLLGRLVLPLAMQSWSLMSFSSGPKAA